MFDLLVLPDYPSSIAYVHESFTASDFINSPATSLKVQAVEANMPSDLLIGYRLSVPAIAKFNKEDKSSSGFCEVFRLAFEKKVKKMYGPRMSVSALPILNEYRARRQFSRYGGLRPTSQGKPLIHIECGPNSKVNGEDEGFEFAKDIEFSSAFYTTGVKLLVNLKQKDTLKQNREASRSLKIAVVTPTTTDIFFSSVN